MTVLNGGKFLGSGTYGCVFFPPIKCNRGKKVDGVGKVLKNTKEYNEEMSIGKKLKNIDKNGEVFNRLVKGCTVNLDNVFEDDDYDSCVHIDETKNNYKQIIYKERGIDLSKYLTENFENYRTTDKNILKHIDNLLKGVKLLHDHNMAHIDLKKENILITNSDEEKLLLFDFGLSRNFDEIYDYDKSDYLLEYNYHIYPPEFKTYGILNDLYNFPITKRFITKEKGLPPSVKSSSYYDELIPYLQYQFEHGPIRGFYMYRNLKKIEELRKDYSDFIKTLVNEMKKNGYTHKSFPIERFFTQHFAKKTDVFSAGTVINSYVRNAISDKNNVLYNFSEKLTSMNAFKRLSIEEAQNELKSIMKKYVKTPERSSSQNSNSVDSFESVNNAESVKSSVSSKKKIVASSSSESFKKCMTHKLKELKNKVAENNLPKKLTQLNRRPLCKEISYIFETNGEMKVDTSTNNFNKCMRLLIKDLKQKVDENNLPKKLKQLNKKDICKEIADRIANQKTSYKTANQKTSYKTATQLTSIESREKKILKENIKTMKLPELKKKIDNLKLPKKLKLLNKNQLKSELMKHI